MRRIEVAINHDIPRRRVDWQRMKDAFRAQWLGFNRHPFSGSVAVGYEWRVSKKPRWQRHTKVWPEIVWLTETAVNGGEPHPGECRFVQSDEPRLTLYLEGP